MMKRGLTVIVCGVLLLFPTAALCAEKGDLNGNGRADLGDAIIGLRVLSGISPAELIANYAASGADVNGDNTVGHEEVIFVLQSVAELRLILQSTAFSWGSVIPQEYACPPEAGGFSPQLSWSNPPANTQSFVLIMEDPDAPGGWTHWIVYDIPASVSSLAKNAGALGNLGLPNGAKHGLNTWNNAYYGGPCPPAQHRYFFRLYALSKPSLNLNPGATRTQVEEAMLNAKLGEPASWMGKYPAQ